MRWSFTLCLCALSGGCSLEANAVAGVAPDAAGDGAVSDAIVDVNDPGAADARDTATTPFVPAFTLVPGESSCPGDTVYAGYADGCVEDRSDCEPRASSFFIDPPVSPWQEIRGRVRGLQGQSPDGFQSDPSSLDEVYVDGISITTDAPREHIWSFAAGLHQPTSPTSGNACPCDNGLSAPALVGDRWTCETGNDAPDFENRAPIYLTDVLWDADGDAHGAGCALVEEPGVFEVRLDAPTARRIEVRIMADSCDDKVTLVELELEVR